MRNGEGVDQRGNSTTTETCQDDKSDTNVRMMEGFTEDLIREIGHL